MPTNENDSILTGLTRRRMLQGAGGLFAAAALPATEAAASAVSASQGTPSRAAVEITGRVARYMVEARDRSLPPQVAREAKHRILDTLGAMVSGARLKPGEMAIRYVRGQGGVPRRRSSPRTSGRRPSTPRWPTACSATPTRPTTSSRSPRRIPVAPSCPPRWRWPSARADRAPSSLRARRARLRSLLPLSAWRWGRTSVRATHRSAEGTSSTFGAAAAAASLARLDESGMRYALSYAAQQVSGHLELGAGYRARRKGVRLRRHGRPQRRHGGDHGRRPGSPA